MEHLVRRYRFRLKQLKRVAECEGRTVERPEEGIKLQVWHRTPEQPAILLEVAPVGDLETVWRQFIVLCAHRGITPLERRELLPSGGLGEWEPFPGRDPVTAR